MRPYRRLLLLLAVAAAVLSPLWYLADRIPS